MSDVDLIKWCSAHGYVFVTKDWRSSYEPYLTKQLKELGVSAARYGIPWYRVCPRPGVYDWEWTDKVLERLPPTLLQTKPES